MTFSLSSMKRTSKIPLYLVLTVAAIGTGIIYLNMLFSDIATGQYLTYDVAMLSIIVSIVALVIYSVGTLVVLWSRDWIGIKNDSTK